MSDVIVNTFMKSLFRTVTENGHKTIELLDSDDEMELAEADTSEDKGMSSDGVTMVGDFDVEMDSDSDDEEPHLFHGSDREKSDTASLDFEIDCNDLEASTNWLDKNITSTVEQHQQRTFVFGHTWWHLITFDQFPNSTKYKQKVNKKLNRTLFRHLAMFGSSCTKGILLYKPG